MNFFRHTVEIAPVQPDTLFMIGSFPISNAMLMGVLVTGLIIVFSLFITLSSKLVPGKFQAAIEMLFEGFESLVGQIVTQKEHARRILPLIGAIFVFFGVSNLIGLIPGLTSITYDGVSLFRTPTNDFNMTFTVALAMVVITNIASIAVFGPLGHLGKFFKVKEIFVGFKQGIGAGFMAIIEFLIGLLDIISELAKVISLSLRLFGNMYAGEILAGILLGAFALVIPSTWLAMNILVGVIQALVFGALTAAYYQLAIAQADDV